MSRSELHDWEYHFERCCKEMKEIAENIYDTAYARGANSKEPKIETKIIGRDTDGNWHDLSFISKQEPKTDGWNEPENPPSDDRLVLVSFANYPVPGIARYIGDEENGGAYYTDESDRSLSSHGFIVNGWMELPKCRED